MATMTHPEKIQTATVLHLQEWDNAVGQDSIQVDRHGLGIDRRTRLLGPVQVRFDKLLPPHRRYIGLRRRWFLTLLLGVIVTLALVIGLAVGLTRSKGSANLPLPSNHEQFTGDLTYYGVGLGACGITSSDGDAIVAVSQTIFDAASTSANPNANPLCGRKIRAQRFDATAGTRRSIDLTVVDRCTGCSPTDLDVSTSAFDHLADRALGRVDVTWVWL